MDRDVESLLDILASARIAKTYVEGVSHHEFLQDGQLQDSVIRRLEIIGEAVGRISPLFREKNPEVPWDRIKAMRNRMIHRYDDVDMTIIWDTVQESIPRLLAMIEPLVPPESGV
ncbi:MAG: DUF86 domain-containing protein [Gammaproteobacteria bacterium]|nr:DUF86 domain-containing protein [Gammaproteobacteria bacterium]